VTAMMQHTGGAGQAGVQGAVALLLSGACAPLAGMLGLPIGMTSSPLSHAHGPTVGLADQLTGQLLYYTSQPCCIL
jgi:hypothetical protein